MAIGLYDADMIFMQKVPFNLEIMKLSTYYKKNHEIVKMLRAIEADRYSKIYYRQDLYQHFPTNLLSNTNVEYGGLAFNPSGYIPLDQSIEKLKADTSIYETFLDTWNMSKIIRNERKVMGKAQHFRFSLDNKTIWEDFDKQITFDNITRNLFLHDYNITKIEGAFDAIKDLLQSFNRRSNNLFLSAKFPIQVDNKNLFDWLTLPSSPHYYVIQYNGIMPDELINDLVSINFNRCINYNITPIQNDDDFLLNQWLPKIYKQAIFIKNNKLNIRFTYDKEFFKNKNYIYLIELFNIMLTHFNSYTTNQYNYWFKRESFASFIQKYANIFVLSDHTKLKFNSIREIFKWVQQNNYYLFKDFYECASVKLEGGEFINDTILH